MQQSTRNQTICRHWCRAISLNSNCCHLPIFSYCTKHLYNLQIVKESLGLINTSQQDTSPKLLQRSLTTTSSVSSKTRLLPKLPSMESSRSTSKELFSGITEFLHSILFRCYQFVCYMAVSVLPLVPLTKFRFVTSNVWSCRKPVALLLVGRAPPRAAILEHQFFKCGVWLPDSCLVQEFSKSQTLKTCQYSNAKVIPSRYSRESLCNWATSSVW